jgi:uncharacterized protein
MSELSPVDDPLAGPFFQAAREGRLVVQRCNSCAALRWPPLSGCPECHSRDTTWVPVAPSGTIWSFVVYHRAFQAELKAEIPYTVAMIELDDGPYLVGRLVTGEKPPAVGDRTVAEFVEMDGVPTVRWRSPDTAPGPGAEQSRNTKAEHKKGDSWDSLTDASPSSPVEPAARAARTP